MDALNQLQYLRQRMLRLETTQEISLLLGRSQRELESMAANPGYQEFTIKKRDGTDRFIEDPEFSLKQMLRSLNGYLQGVYYFEKPDAAYGFIPTPDDDPNPPRNIVTHAEQHLGCKWLMNIDLESFFHQISTEKTAKTLSSQPFQLNDDAASLLARLSTYKGRLPMGSPCSPVLSNLAFLPEDAALEHWAATNGWRYTRYADDLTFSSNAEIGQKPMQQTINLIENHGYRVHPKKRKLCGPGDEKSVTRLVLGPNSVQLPGDFHAELKEQIQDLSSTMRVQQRMGETDAPWIQKYQQRVRGMVGFAEHVLGKHTPEFNQLRNAFQDASNPPAEDFGTYSWLDFPYWGF